MMKSNVQLIFFPNGSEVTQNSFSSIDELNWGMFVTLDQLTSFEFFFRKHTVAKSMVNGVLFATIDPQYKKSFWKFCA